MLQNSLHLVVRSPPRAWGWTRSPIGEGGSLPERHPAPSQRRSRTRHDGSGSRCAPSGKMFTSAWGITSSAARSGACGASGTVAGIRRSAGRWWYRRRRSLSDCRQLSASRRLSRLIRRFLFVFGLRFLRECRRRFLRYRRNRLIVFPSHRRIAHLKSDPLSFLRLGLVQRQCLDRDHRLLSRGEMPMLQVEGEDEGRYPPSQRHSRTRQDASGSR